MIKVILVEMECENEGEIDGLINAIDGVIDYHCSFAEHDMTVDVTEGVFNVNKTLRRIAKEEK